ncbi:MAG TPA: hypothetical protein VFE63_14335 [Roseiarcus sp.]|nr:hypothetical protein [Roseiarcus sp.]
MSIVAIASRSINLLGDHARFLGAAAPALGVILSPLAKAALSESFLVESQFDLEVAEFQKMLPSGPIENMVELVEDNGGIVIPCEGSFCFAAGKDQIFHSTGKPMRSFPKSIRMSTEVAGSSQPLVFFQRFSAAAFAISARRSGVIFAARAAPPFLPSAFAAWSFVSSGPKSSGSSPVATLMTLTAAPITSAGRRSPLGPRGVFSTFVPTQHALEDADLLCNNIDRVVSR